MGFIRERVLELQGDLNFLYHKLSTDFLKETVYSFAHQKTTDSTQAQQTNIGVETFYDTESIRIISNAVQSVSIENGQIPDLKVILNQLDRVEKGLHKIKEDDGEETTSVRNEEFKAVLTLLEWIFLAKVMVVLYAKVMERLLLSTLPLSDSIFYWEKIHGSKFSTITYLIQS